MKTLQKVLEKLPLSALRALIHIREVDTKNLEKYGYIAFYAGNHCFLIRAGGSASWSPIPCNKTKGYPHFRISKNAVFEIQLELYRHAEKQPHAVALPFDWDWGEDNPKGLEFLRRVILSAIREVTRNDLVKLATSRTDRAS